MSIYKEMREDWSTYCLMAGIAIIEEFSKPNLGIKRVMNSKGNIVEYYSYKDIRLKMKHKETVKWWLETTIYWEEILGQEFINTKKLGKDQDQFTLYFNSNWAYHILKEIKEFPSKYTQECYFNKIENWKFSKNKYMLSSKDIKYIQETKESLYTTLYKDKFLAAGALVVSFDLEFKGCQSGRLCLTMSEKYKDFLEFMLDISNLHNWSTKNSLTPVSVDYSIKIGIKANPQFCFRLKTYSLKEIHNLAGPLIDKHKDKCIKYHIKRSSNYKNRGYKAIKSNKTKDKLYNALKELGTSKTTNLQFYVNVGQDIIVRHLNDLEKKGKIEKERVGKRYIWSIKNANKRKT